MANRRKPNPAQILGPPAPAPKVTAPAAQLNVPQPVKPSPKALIIARQNTLLAHGYDVASDGVWGSQSQTAWSHYVYWKRRGQPFHAIYDSPANSRTGRVNIFGTPADKAAWQAIQDKKNPGAATLRTIRDAAKKVKAVDIAGPAVPTDKAAAKAAVATKFAQDQADLNKLGGTVAADPSVAARLPLTTVVRVLSNPETPDLVPTAKTGATAIQYWLNANGFKVDQTGTFDRATHDALLHAFKQADAIERKKEVKALVNKLYKPYGIHAGDTPYWWPGGKPVPQPADLLLILQSGSLEAHAIETAITTRMNQDAFDHARDAQLITMATRLSLPSQAAADRISGHKMTRFEAFTRLWGLNGDVRFHAEVVALYTAKSQAEFEHVMQQINKYNEYLVATGHKSLLHTTLHAFGTGLHYLLAPGEYTRRKIVEGVQSADYLGRYIARHEGGTLLVPTDPSPPSDATAQAYIDSLPFWPKLFFEMVVDPLNFFAPFKIASTGFRFAGFKAFGGYVIRETAAEGLKHSEGLIAKSFGLVYTKGTWSKLALPKAVDHFVTGGAIASSRPVKAIDNIAGKAAAIKPHVVAKVRSTTVIASRHGFQTPALVKLDAAAASAIGKGVKDFKMDSLPTASKDITDATRAGGHAVKAVLVKHPRYKVIIDALVKSGGSMFVDAGRKAHSVVGAIIIARHAEEARIQVTHQLAQEVYDRVFSSHYPDYFPDRAAYVEKLTLSRDAGQITTKELGTALHSFDLGYYASDIAKWDHATDLAKAEYDKVMGVVSAHITGGTDKALTYGTGVLDKHGVEIQRVVIDEIRERQRNIMDAFETTIVPAMHELVQEGFDVLGKPLWDAAGKWIGHGTLEDRILRDLGQEAFNPDHLIPVANPQFGMGHTLTQMQDAISDEMARTTNRLYWRAARDAAAGRSDDRRRGACRGGPHGDRQALGAARRPVLRHSPGGSRS
jgi:hypothetical protein